MANKNLQIIGVISIIAYFFLVSGGINYKLDNPVHGDVAVYFLLAKQEVEEKPLIKRFNWEEIKQNLREGKVEERYRNLARWGNPFIISLVFRFVKGLQCIKVVRALYSIMFLMFFIIMFLSICEITGGGGDFYL